MRTRLLGITFVAIATLGVAGPAGAKSPCEYKGKESALPNAGLPVYVYANGDTSPSGYGGIGDGTSDTYGQFSGSAGGVQIEGKSKAIGQSGYANSGASYGSC